MVRLLNEMFQMVARIHTDILTWNDSFETVMTDKQLHFWVIGLLGMALLLFIFPLFKLLSKHHVVVIAWIYVFTVMVVITFAIEIGQGLTHTGTMDIDDIVYGLAGFMTLFIIFEVIRLLLLGLVHLIFPKKKGKK